MPNNKKKKRIYSKNKTPIYKTDKHIENSFDLICKIKKNESDVWQRYIKYVVWNNDAKGELKAIIDEIQDNFKKKSILLELMKIEEFNPFFPNYKIIQNETTRNYLIKKRNYYNQYKNYCRLLHFDCCQGIIFHTSHDDKNDDYNIKVIFNSHSRKIIFKNDIKNHFDVEKIYNELNQLDNNVWSMYNSQTYMYVNKDCKSKLDLRTIVDIVKNNEKRNIPTK